MGALQIGIGLGLGVTLAIIGQVIEVLADMQTDRHLKTAAEIVGAGRAAAIFVDIVAIMEDEIEVLAREVSVRAVIAVLEILASHDAELEALDGRLRERQRARAAAEAALSACGEAVPIGALRLQPADLDMHAVRGLGSGDHLALRDDRGETVIARHLPVDRHRRHRHPAMRFERIGGEPGPDDETVGRGIARGDPQREGEGAKHALRPEDAGRGESERRGGDEQAA